MKVINVEQIWKKMGVTATVTEIPAYIEIVTEEAGLGEEVVLTGAGPVWLYLVLAHALHGKCRKLIYNSPLVSVEVFDHTS